MKEKKTAAQRANRQLKFWFVVEKGVTIVSPFEFMIMMFCDIPIEKSAKKQMIWITTALVVLISIWSLWRLTMEIEA